MCRRIFQHFWSHSKTEYLTTSTHTGVFILTKLLYSGGIEVNRLTKKLVSHSQSVKLTEADGQDRMSLSGKRNCDYSRRSRYYLHLSVVCSCFFVLCSVSLPVSVSFTYVVFYWLVHRRAFRSGMINGFLWFAQMCLWQRMRYNVYNQTQKPLVVIILFLSVCFAVSLFLKALHLLLQMCCFVSHHWYPAGWNCVHIACADTPFPWDINSSWACQCVFQSHYSRVIKSDWYQIKFCP